MRSYSIRFFLVWLTVVCVCAFHVRDASLGKCIAGPRLARNLAINRIHKAGCIPLGLRMSGGGEEKPTIGFLGMGIMGVPMALNLIKAGYSVTVWNRNRDKCADVISAGAKEGKSPADVVRNSVITFAMLSDPVAALAVAIGDTEHAAVNGIMAGKAYIDCSTVSVDCSQRIASAVRENGGRFLEAPVSGSKKPAEDAQLIFLCGGDKSLYDVAEPIMRAMGKKTVFLGDVGAGAKMKLVVNMVMGSMLAGLSEGISLAEHIGLKTEEVLEVLDAGAMSNPMFRAKGALMQEQKREYPTAFPLKHAQKDLRLALNLADAVHLPLPVSAAANEVYKQARALGQSDADFAAVHAAQTANALPDHKVVGGTWVVDHWQ